MRIEGAPYVLKGKRREKAQASMDIEGRSARTKVCPHSENPTPTPVVLGRLGLGPLSFGTIRDRLRISAHLAGGLKEALPGIFFFRTAAVDWDHLVFTAPGFTYGA